MKTPTEIVEALKRHYGQGYAYPCAGCPYGGKSRSDENCRFELTRDALELIEQLTDKLNNAHQHLREKDELVYKLHKTDYGVRFAYELGELVFVPAKCFSLRSTKFDFVVKDDPDRLVPARVVGLVARERNIFYEVRALDKNQRMQGERVVLAPQHLTAAYSVVKGAYAK